MGNKRVKEAESLRADLTSNPVMTGHFETKTSQEEKWLGEYFSQEGLRAGLSKTIKTRLGAVKGASFELARIAWSHAARMSSPVVWAMAVFKGAVLSRLLYNAGTMMEIAPAELAAMDRAQTQFLKTLLKAPGSTPNIVVETELDVFKVSSMVEVDKLSFANRLQLMHPDWLAAQCWKREKDMEWGGGLLGETERLARKLEIPHPRNLNAGKKEYRTMAKKAVRRRDLIERKEAIEKSKKYMRGEDEEVGEVKDYVFSADIGFVSEVFRIRAMSFLGGDIYRDGRDESKCLPVCQERLSTEHALECPHLENMKTNLDMEDPMMRVEFIRRVGKTRRGERVNLEHVTEYGREKSKRGERKTEEEIMNLEELMNPEPWTEEWWDIFKDRVAGGDNEEEREKDIEEAEDDFERKWNEILRGEHETRQEVNDSEVPSGSGLLKRKSLKRMACSTAVLNLINDETEFQIRDFQNNSEEVKPKMSKARMKDFFAQVGGRLGASSGGAQGGGGGRDGDSGGDEDENRKKRNDLKNTKTNIKEERHQPKPRRVARVVALMSALLLLAHRATEPRDIQMAARELFDELELEPMPFDFELSNNSTIQKVMNDFVSEVPNALRKLERTVDYVSAADDFPGRGGRSITLTQAEEGEARFDELLYLNDELRQERNRLQARVDELENTSEIASLRLNNNQLEQEVRDGQRALRAATISNNVLSKERDKAKSEMKVQHDVAEDWRAAAAQLGSMVNKFTKGGHGEASRMLEEVVRLMSYAMQGERERRERLVQEIIAAAAEADAGEARAAQQFRKSSEAAQTSSSSGSGSASSLQSPGGGPQRRRVRKASQGSPKPPGLPARQGGPVNLARRTVPGSTSSLPPTSVRRNPLLEAGRRGSEPGGERARVAASAAGGIGGVSQAQLQNQGQSQGGLSQDWGVWRVGQVGWAGSSGSQAAGLQSPSYPGGWAPWNFSQREQHMSSQAAGQALPGQVGHHPYCLYGQSAAQQQASHGGWGNIRMMPGGQLAQASGLRGTQDPNQLNPAQFTQMAAPNPVVSTGGFGSMTGVDYGGYSTTTTGSINVGAEVSHPLLPRQLGQGAQQSFVPQQQLAARTENIGREEGTSHGVTGLLAQTHHGQGHTGSTSLQQPTIVSPQSPVVSRSFAQVGDNRALPLNQTHLNFGQSTMPASIASTPPIIFPSHSHSHPRPSPTAQHTITSGCQHTNTATLGRPEVAPRLTRSSTDPEIGREDGSSDGQSAEPSHTPRSPPTTTTPPPTPPTPQTTSTSSDNFRLLDHSHTQAPTPTVQHEVIDLTGDDEPRRGVRLRPARLIQHIRAISGSLNAPPRFPEDNDNELVEGLDLESVSSVSSARSSSPRLGTPPSSPDPPTPTASPILSMPVLSPGSSPWSSPPPSSSASSCLSPWRLEPRSPYSTQSSPSSEDPEILRRHYYHPDTPPSPCIRITIHRSPVIPPPPTATLDPSDLRNRLINRHPSFSSCPQVSRTVSVSTGISAIVSSNNSRTGPGSPLGEARKTDPKSEMPNPNPPPNNIRPNNPVHGDSPAQAAAYFTAGAAGEAVGAAMVESTQPAENEIKPEGINAPEPEPRPDDAAGKCPTGRPRAAQD